MPALPALTGKEVVKKLKKAGLAVVRIKGSHHIMRGDGGKYAAIPVHGNKIVKRGTLSNILEGAQISVEQFIKL